MTVASKQSLSPTMTMGLGFRDTLEADRAERLVAHALSSGVRSFDVANAYGLGDSRLTMGSSERALQRAAMLQHRDP